MKVLILNDTATVFRIGDDLALTADGATGDGWQANIITTENATLLELEEAPAGLQPGWKLENATLLPPAPSREDLKAAATSLRWDHETGGITLPGDVFIATGIADQNRIASVMAIAASAGVATVDFKATSGWVSMSLAQVSAVAAAIALHVQACFSAERRHHEAIDALLTDADLRAYDVTAGWPGA